MDTLYRDDGETVRLVQVGGDLCDELVRGHTDRGGEAGDFFDPALDAAGDGDRIPEQRLARSDVQKRLIQRQALHDRGDFVENAEDLVGRLFVACHSWPNANRVGAKAEGRAHRHGRERAVFTHLVTCGRHDSAACYAPYDERLSE